MALMGPHFKGARVKKITAEKDDPAPKKAQAQRSNEADSLDKLMNRT